MINNNLFRDLLRYGKIKADFEAKDTMGRYIRIRVFEYQEKKQYIKKDENGEAVTYTEISTKYQPPSETAIFGALNRFDPNYKKDKAYYELKKQELELKKEVAKSNNFDLNID